MRTHIPYRFSRFMRAVLASLVLVSTLSLAGCSDSSEQEQAQLNLHQWLDQQYMEERSFSPEALSRAGDHSRHGELNEVSQVAFQEQLQWKKASVERMKELYSRDELNSAEQISYDLWAYQYEQMQRGAEFRHMEYVFEQMIGPQSRLPQFILSGHRVHTQQDMGDYNKRIRAIGHRIEELLQQAQQRAENGVRPPRFAYEEVIRQARAVIEGAPFSESGVSPIWQDAQAKISQLREQGRLNQQAADLLLQDTRRALSDDLLPAYQALIDWLQQDMANTETNPTGITRHEGGDQYYDYLLWFYTTTDMTAEQIHQLGLDEVDRIREQMLDIKQRVGFEGNLNDFFDFFRTDEQFFYPNTDVGREAYLQQARDYLNTLDQYMPDFFGLLPQIDLKVRRVEAYREQAGAPQHYMRGSVNGTPGIFYAHLIDMSGMAKNELEAITYHEGIPGHHLQISVAQQATDIPRFRTQARFTVFTEGWALYAEWLAREMGAYQDPYSEFGQLVTELWRAVRLVVDTGLHAKGWTYEQAVDYFTETTPVASGTIRTEVERYMTIPGQATSFKVGMIRIQQLRREAEQALGEQFDIREFHDTVLSGGAMPIPLLERQVRNWIESKT